MSESVRTLEEQENATVDIRSLMAEIRERIKADVERSRDARMVRSPLAGKFVDDKGLRFGDLQQSENLRYLNVNYAFETKLSPNAIVTHRKGFLGTLIVKLKRKFALFLRNGMFSEYLIGERLFIEHLVRHLNDTGRYIDARDENMEQLLRRLDDEKVNAIFSVQRQIGEIVQGFEQRLATVDAMVRGLEGIVNNVNKYTHPYPPAADEALPTGDGTAPSMSYLLLENRFRGSEGEIERRLRLYPEIFRASRGPVLEIGSGRGELQRLFREARIDSYGVDLDVVMVNVANANGCKTVYGDGIAHLRSLEDRSLGGLVAIQVVEHLLRDQLQELCELAKRKVIAGGRIAFETINPKSLLALSSNYFRDPTHVWPMHPDTLGYMATLAGLKIIETKMLSPVSPNHLLQEIPNDPTYNAAMSDAVRRLNENIHQLNRLLYGYQDYCLVLEA